MEWKDVTTYNKYKKGEKPSTFAYQTDHIRIVVTNGHIHFPGKWVMNCGKLGLNCYGLKVDTLEEAKEKALSIARKILENMINSLPEKTIK